MALNVAAYISCFWATLLEISGFPTAYISIQTLSSLHGCTSGIGNMTNIIYLNSKVAQMML